ncbi:MAG: hypothetical protein K0R09_2997, partial [Clostridiales bacterium]|nr:hypothetical protein [Clostridiales bacterium]
IIIQPSDTMRFEKAFCRELYSKGYKLSNKIINEILK